MCVIVHKPRDARIPADLLEASLRLNADGWGLMGFDADGELVIERHAETDADAIRAALDAHPEGDLVLHLRQRTRGSNEIVNAHPFKIADGLYLMHNGTLPLGGRVPGRSDTWHLVNDLLRPLHGRYPGLLADEAFLQLLELGLKPENKVVLLDAKNRSSTVPTGRSSTACGCPTPAGSIAAGYLWPIRHSRSSAVIRRIGSTSAEPNRNGTSTELSLPSNPPDPPAAAGCARAGLPLSGPPPCALSRPC